MQTSTRPSCCANAKRSYACGGVQTASFPDARVRAHGRTLAHLALRETTDRCRRGLRCLCWRFPPLKSRGAFQRDPRRRASREASRRTFNQARGITTVGSSWFRTRGSTKPSFVRASSPNRSSSKLAAMGLQATLHAPRPRQPRSVQGRSGNRADREPRAMSRRDSRAWRCGMRT